MIHKVLISLWPVAPYVPQTQWLSHPACSWNMLWQVIHRPWVCLPQLRLSPPVVALDSCASTTRNPRIGLWGQTGRGVSQSRGSWWLTGTRKPQGWQQAESTPWWEQTFTTHYKSCMSAAPPGCWSVRTKTWNCTEAAELLGGLCNETKKKCPRLKEEVLTGSLQHHFWLHLPLGLQLWFMTF